LFHVTRHSNRRSLVVGFQRCLVRLFKRRHVQVDHGLHIVTDGLLVQPIGAVVSHDAVTQSQFNVIEFVTLSRRHLAQCELVAVYLELDRLTAAHHLLNVQLI